MKCRTRAALALLAATVGLPLLAQPARGQQRVGSDGHAADANTMVGSGGYNTATNRNWLQNYQAFEQDIVYGNITRGQAFAGKDYKGVNLGSGISDPFAFRGLLAGEGIDQFIGESTGMPTHANPFASSQSISSPPQPYYGQANHNELPGYQQASNGAIYVPTPPVTAQPWDARLGNVVPPEDATELPKPDTLFLPGPVDPTANSTTYFKASLLYGPQQWNLNGQNSNLFSTPNGEQSNASASGPDTDYFQHLAPNKLMELRQELSLEGGTGLGMPSPQANLGAKALAPLQPQPLPLQGQALPPLIPSGTGPLTSNNLALPLGVAPEKNAAANPSGFVLPAPEQQSAQYAQLQKQYNASHPKTPLEAEREFQALLHGPAGQMPGALTPSGGVPPPMQIPSIATGVHAKGLAGLLGRAETLVRQQQYDKAISAYDDAIEVAPNNPLFLMGRAEAELGGGYYGQADDDLHSALMHGHALLLSQYDLDEHFGRARVQAIEQDLKKFADGSPDNPTPAFLLAYIDYNTHQEAQAAAWLEKADKRSAGKDPVIPLMKEFWTFPKPAPSTQPAPAPMQQKTRK